MRKNTMKFTNSLYRKSPLEQEIIRMIFKFLENKRNSDQWWKYKGEFNYDGKDYVLEVEARMDNHMLTYRNMFIEYKQGVIDVDDLAARGLLN